jgi:hypothetical protein
MRLGLSLRIPRRVQDQCIILVCCRLLQTLLQRQQGGLGHGLLGEALLNHG